MSRELIRTLGQIHPEAVGTFVLYNVPKGASTVISSITVIEFDAVATHFDIIIFPEAVTHAEGKARTITVNKLIDSAATFMVNGVAIGDRVENVFRGASATVVSVDSETQLTLSANIFTVISDRYFVYPTSSPVPGERNYIRFFTPITANGFVDIKLGITLSEFTQIRVNVYDDNLSFSCFGVEILPDL